MEPQEHRDGEAQEAGGWLQPRASRLETREDQYFSLSLKTRKTNVAAGRLNFLLLNLFVLLRSSIDWIRLIYITEANIFHSVYQFKC